MLLSFFLVGNPVHSFSFDFHSDQEHCMCLGMGVWVKALEASKKELNL